LRHRFDLLVLVNSLSTDWEERGATITVNYLNMRQAPPVLTRIGTNLAEEEKKGRARLLRGPMQGVLTDQTHTKGDR